VACGRHLHHDREAAAPGKRSRVGIVQYKRQDDDPDADDEDPSELDSGRAFVRFVADNEPLLDAILHDWYPDKLPGELDDMDLLRFWRMVEAKGIIAAEDARRQFFSGDAKAPQKSEGERYRQHQRNVAKWADHDRLLRQFGLLED